MTERVKVIEGWVPLPEIVTKALGWKEGDLIAVEVVGSELVCSKLEDAPVKAPRKR